VNANSTNRRSARNWRYSLGGLLLAAGGLIDQRTAAAPTELSNLNSVLANPAPASPLQTQEQQDLPNEMDVFQPAGGNAGSPLPEIFRYGSVQLRPRADYDFSYGTGIQSAPGNAEAMIIQQFSPGLRADLGRHWALDYSPTFQFYSSDKFQNTVNQAFALTGGFEYSDWSFGLSQSAGYSSSPTVATATQTDQSSYVTGLKASRVLISNLSADLGLSQSIALVSGYEDTYDWSALGGLNYQFWPRLSAGISAGAGYTLVENNSLAGGATNPNQTHEQVEAHFNWRATDKISFQIHGGVDDRQFQTAGSGDSLSPIFGATVQYKPVKNTQISLTANRTAGASEYYLAAQETETTSVGINLNQRLFRQYTLGLGAAYAETDYGTAASAASAAAANRTDDEVSFSARLSHPFFKRGTWSIYYQYSDNTSSHGGFGFASNQSGFNISYSF